ncbi:YnfU family zinc-binding protein [Kosakonia cowanii]|uniref:YnfU family zinc-binding protein n=1 Tax=Kosakonia TaxID=1330547 RepID=UPI001C9DCDDF|nr:YnfU family zinc-binding protein [Kosakonia cowanii]WPG19986.1 YnfU family zinc-binding protein [Kosakonia cowanii]
MSIIDYAMKFISGASMTPVICPVCGFRSSQSLAKVRRKQAMLCPGCKALFVSSP